MDLPNERFVDFPIEFKEINPSDFENFIVDDKIIIEPNEDGYINDALQENFNLDEKNTIVVNAAVGQGKSYSIIKTIEKYYHNKKDKKYLIIVASPFVSLVQQYCDDIHKDANIPVNQIYNYLDLGRNSDVTYLDKAVQVVTVNTLLGNPGEEGYKNSDAKREYLSSLIKKCRRDEIEVVFIYDEIHDSIHNFKEEFVFSLWKWKDVILKNYIISATYNEASKIVIGYLAELTDNKIKIIESKRKRFPSNQSELHLHYNTSWQYSYKDNDIVDIVNNLAIKGKSIDILCYSKSLANDIIKSKDSPIKKILESNLGEINNCTSELVSNQRTENEEPKNRYKNDRCNVGTNFKTGVSIKKDNHAFVIIMPPRGTRLWFSNKYGIFSGGINSIIQALARQRQKGEIHIVLPKPDKFDFTSLQNSEMNDNQKEEFTKYYKRIENHEDTDDPVKYFPLNVQDYLMLQFHKEKLEGYVEDEINHLKAIDRSGFTRLKFPSYDLFKLGYGEDYLASTFPFFGEDISAYVTYCAFTNQFINCNLKSIVSKNTLFFEKGKVQRMLFDFYRKYLGEDYFYFSTEFFNEKMFYLEFKNHLFKTCDVYLKQTSRGKYAKISKDKDKYFENQILLFSLNMLLGSKGFDINSRLQESEFNRKIYFQNCITLVNNYSEDDSRLTESERDRIKAYNILDYFRKKIIRNIGFHSYGRNQYYYIPVKPLEEFYTGSDIIEFEKLREFLIESDDFIKNNVFKFKDVLQKKSNENLSSKLSSFYSYLIEDFINIKTTPRYRSLRLGQPIKRRRVFEVESLFYPNSHNNRFDLISPADYINEKVELSATTLTESMINSMITNN